MNLGLQAKKLFEEIKKNYIVAARNPLNYLIFILGPILFVILVGLSFSGTNIESDMNILVVGDANISLVSYIEEIENVNVLTSPSVNECKEETLQRNIHGCIKLGDNETRSVEIYLDFSRMSRVYLIQTALERQIENLRYDLSIESLKKLQDDIDLKQEGEVQDFFTDLNQGLENLRSDVEEMKSSIEENRVGFSQNTDAVKEDFETYLSLLLNFQDDAENYGNVVDERTEKLVNLQERLSRNRDDINLIASSQCGGDGQDYSQLFLGGGQAGVPDSANECDLIVTSVGFLTYFDEEVTDVIDELNQVSRGLDELDELILRSIGDLNRYLGVVEEEKELVDEDLSNTLRNLEETLTMLSGYEESSAGARDSLVSFSNELQGIREDLDFDSFVDPVNYRVRNTLGTSNALDNLLPLIMSVVILFTALLLGVVIHKKETGSKGYQRNILQGSKMRFYLANYFFVLLTIIAEVLILLAAFYVFFDISHSLNILYFVLAAGLYISLWTFTGFFLAGMAKTGEIAFISAVTLSITIFLFSGGLVSIETFPVYMNALAQLSPMVHFEEVLREIFFLEPSSVTSGLSVFYLIGLTISTFLAGYLVTKGEENG